jgi:hypothetical protein
MWKMPDGRIVRSPQVIWNKAHTRCLLTRQAIQANISNHDIAAFNAVGVYPVRYVYPDGYDKAWYTLTGPVVITEEPVHNGLGKVYAYPTMEPSKTLDKARAVLKEQANTEAKTLYTKYDGYSLRKVRKGLAIPKDISDYTDAVDVALSAFEGLVDGEDDYAALTKMKADWPDDPRARDI